MCGNILLIYLIICQLEQLLMRKFYAFMGIIFLFLFINSGLSPHLKTIDQMRTIERNIEIPHEGPFCDLMWSDPDDIDGWCVSNRGAGNYIIIRMVVWWS